MYDSKYINTCTGTLDVFSHCRALETRWSPDRLLSKQSCECFRKLIRSKFPNAWSWPSNKENEKRKKEKRFAVTRSLETIAFKNLEEQFDYSSRYTGPALIHPTVMTQPYALVVFMYENVRFAPAWRSVIGRARLEFSFLLGWWSSLELLRWCMAWHVSARVHWRDFGNQLQRYDVHAHACAILYHMSHRCHPNQFFANQIHFDHPTFISHLDSFGDIDPHSNQHWIVIAH